MRRSTMRWWVVMVSALLLGSGCAGIITEQTGAGGNTERVRLDMSSKWSSWDHNATKPDDSCLILKKESTF